MKFRHQILGLVLAALGVLPLAAAPARAGGGRTLVVSILPQAYFVDRISGGGVKAVVLVGAGQSPHSYEPTPRQMAALAKADAWLSIGVDFEKGLMPKVAALYPGLRIVDGTRGIRYRQLEAHHHEGEAEDHEEEESGADAHVWLGRQGAIAIATNTRDVLVGIDPAGASIYGDNCAALVRDIEAAFDGLRPLLAPLKDKPVFVYHPAFGYFLDEFGIVQEAVETGGKEPTQKALAALIAEARADGAKVIFVQAQFPASAAKTVASAIGGVVEVIDPLAPDWLENIRRLGSALATAAERQ